MKRTDEPKESTSPTRSQSVKIMGTIDRNKISLPIALISTTNQLSYDAPDIATLKTVSSMAALSPSSADDSDHSVSTRSRASSHGSRDTTLTDASSVDLSPISPAASQFAGQLPTGGKLKKSASTTSLKRVKEEIVEPIPSIPARALSHSTRAHERLAHQRSLNNVGSRGSMGSRGSISSLRSSRQEQRASLDMFKGTILEEGHPFGRELEQLNEVVEEFGGVVRDAEAQADYSIMQTKNLAAYCAADYLAEIRPLFSQRFGMPHPAPSMAWI